MSEMQTMNELPIEILVVDDNDDDVLIIQEAFTQEKLVNVLQVVRDGEEALAYLRRQGKYHDAGQPGLVLLDINMPKKDGLEVLKEIKQDASLRHIPVVMLTTSSRDEDVIRSYSGGACSYITKPVMVEKLREVLKQFELYWALVSKIPARRRETT